ncbi:hypothetical protein ILUMI_04038 [Ignelater luminosus]|uniref:Peptidase M14 domain-containing protein n=1 Tax=Ignelater luminosus TaxID=2038154 RepID=A0A8K0DF71_IGNLU|nr:hypothetical protein ILUMI_04038 [Ignelater luminosus]
MGKKDDFFLNKFPKYYEIKKYLKKMEKKYPRNVRLEDIGCSVEGRPIRMIVIQEDQRSPKQAVMIEAGIHAREWLTHTTVLYIIQHIVKHQRILRHMDFYIIPCLNPDGYEYSHKHNRLWRKNMNKNGFKDKTHWGVDLNRNFSYGYGLDNGSSSDPQSLVYRGPYCLSEPEAQSLASALYVYGKYIKLYIAIHCYGNTIMYPWGFTEKPIPDEKDLYDCAVKAQRAMKCAYSKSCFTVGCMSKTVYLSSGATADYARGAYNIKFSYTMELHKAGKSGFTPRPSMIVNVAKETLVGVLEMVKYVDRYYKCNTKTYARSRIKLRDRRYE